MIALLVNPKSPQTEGVIRDVQETARAMRVQLQILKAATESEIDAAFASFVQRAPEGLVVMADVFFINQGEQIQGMLTRHAIPAISPWREWVEAGALIAYGPSLTAAIYQQGIYVGKILNGAKLADLPVQQPTTFELVVNLNTAKALGITVPPSILARADAVIE